MRTYRTRIAPFCFAWTVAVCLGVGPSVEAAGTQVDVAGAYAFTEGLGDQNDYRVGWLGSVGWRFARYLEALGEVGGGYHTLPSGSDAPPNHLREYTFMGGGRLTAGSENQAVRPFAQFVVGSARFENRYGSVTHFCWQPGGGIDIQVNRLAALRLGADVRIIPTEFTTSRQFRLTAGIAFTR